ncbi:MAG: VOC family protein [Candidatus Verstraetearchaeota archaeon]|nr:VOC family protein [Candidatus Verstraetearchaeota archaeon]
MPRVIHFEICVDDPDRAIKFYEKVFGWKIGKWGGPLDYWLIEAGKGEEPGIDGALMKRMDPRATTINTISVPSVGEFIKKIEKAGGKRITKKEAIPGVGYFAYCQDTEGNTFGIMESDKLAK